MRYRDHAWFVAFAPVEAPEIAVAVFVEHGLHGSTSRRPIAQRVLQRYFEKTGRIAPPAPPPAPPPAAPPGRAVARDAAAPGTAPPLHAPAGGARAVD